MFVAVLGRLPPFPAPVSPLSSVGVEGVDVGVSPFIGGVGLGSSFSTSSFSETISIATLQSSLI